MVAQQGLLSLTPGRTVDVRLFLPYALGKLPVNGAKGASDMQHAGWRYGMVFAAGLIAAFSAAGQSPIDVDVNRREFIKSWLVCGPFPNPLAEGVTEYRHDETTLGLDTDYLQPVGGEAGVQPQEGLAVAGPDGAPRTWQAHASTGDYVDLCMVFTDNQGGKVAYAACRLVSDADRSILLGLGSNDGVRAWVNGTMVWDHPGARGADMDQDLVTVPVKAGANWLLLKIDQGWGGWGLYARVVDRDQKIAELMAAREPEMEIAFRDDSGKLTVWMGRTSKYTILEPRPAFRAVIRKPDGASVAEASSTVGDGAVFDALTLPPGPYWVTCTAELPNQRTVTAEEFYHRGHSPVTVRVYDAQGEPAELRVEMLRDGRQARAASVAEYAALGDRPELEVVENGVAKSGPGKWEVLRTDVSPFWLRVLLDAPGLGRQWYLTGMQTLAPGETKEIDALAEAERALRTQFMEMMESGTKMSEDVYQSVNARLSATPFRPRGRKPAEIYHGLQTLSSMKSALITEGPLAVWYAPGTEKVGLAEAVPDPKVEAAAVSLARNEYEPFQLVLQPADSISGVTVTVTPPKSKDNQILDAANITVNRVEYVNVEMVSDYYGALGRWPDPLPRLSGPIDLDAGLNQPLWITVYAPRNQLPGIYKGMVTVQAEGMTPVEIPFQVTIHNAVLPAETHTETAYGVSPDFSWHGPLTPEQQAEVFDQYMRLCASHRISPYTPHALAPFDLRFEGDPPKPVLNFARFDKAMTRYLDELKFTSFNLGGLPADLNGQPRYSPEYNQLFKAAYSQVQEHLREKGWLGKAYWYWVDEPPPSQYADVKKGMALLKDACPEIRRLLTCNQEDAPVPYFFDAVNLWVPILDRYDPERARARQERGETLWWYVCTGPKAPYANNFIDHPAINHRIRYWQMDRYGLDGDLYWSATYWAQNPWQQAMSISDSGGPWGNGDGRLLYPPRRDKPAEAVVEPPVTSIRFENLRDGLEDRECLIALERAAAQRGPNGTMARAILGEARAELSPSLTCYSQNPLLLSIYRYQVIRALELIGGAG